MNALSNKLARAALRAALQDDFALFVREAWSSLGTDELIWNWHIDALCKHLQAVVIAAPMFDRTGAPLLDANGKQRIDTIRRLLINVPPGTAKSTNVSILFPAWVWTFKPEHKFMSTSHNIELSTEHALASRRLIESEWYQTLWPIQLKSDQNQKTNYQNDAFGFRKASAFSSLIGKRANTVIADDPQTPDDAHSVAGRTNAIRQFRNVGTRINNPREDSIIVIMQRLHEDDISGFILEDEKESEGSPLHYTHVCIAMEYEGPRDATCIGWTDPRTQDGELLFPAHMPQSWVSNVKATTGIVEYAGQFQQTPVPATAGILDRDWFQRFTIEEFRNWFRRGDAWVNVNFYMTSDHAPAGSLDQNVFQVWAIDNKSNCYLVEMFAQRCRMEVALGLRREDGEKLSLAGMGALPMIRRWKPLAYFPEKDHAWYSNENLFKQALRETGTYVVIKPESPHGRDKNVKVGPFAALASLGQVFIPKNKWGEEALDQYARFPNGRHDDIVDASAMIGRVCSRMIRGEMPDAEEERRKEDYIAAEDEDGASSFYA